MKIDWTARGMTVPDPMRQRVDSRLDKLARFLRGGGEAHVVVTQEGSDSGTSRCDVEIVVRHKLGTFTARDASHELIESANTVLARIETQVRKAHDKATQGSRRVDGVASVDFEGLDPGN